MADRDAVTQNPSVALTLREQVYEIVHLVPPGRAVAYGDIAELLGMSARMVGRYLALNDDPGLPWWRVVNRQGRLPGGLLPAAARHWADEGTPVVPGDRVQMSRALADLGSLADAAEGRLGSLPGASGWAGEELGPASGRAPRGDADPAPGADLSPRPLVREP